GASGTASTGTRPATCLPPGQARGSAQGSSPVRARRRRGLVTARRGQPSAVPVPLPQSTYRLQLQPGFGFADAAQIAGYLASLGVTHAYLSPILQAMPGSAHGYDVVDHSRLSARLGGEGGVRDMVASFPPHGLRGLGDVVRN